MIGRRRRRRKQIVDDLKDQRGSWKLQEEALDRSVWWNGFRKGHGPAESQTTE
jgi:hypothetical protein